MNKTLKNSILFFSIAILFVGCNKPGSISEGRSDSPKSNITELKYLVLEGSPYNRGFVHGKTLKSEISEIVNRWNADISKSSGMDSDTLIKKFLADTDFITAIKKWTPGLLEEVKGISDGSEIDFDTILTYNLPDEVWHYIDENISDKCSAIGISKRGNMPSYVAQNMDLEHFRNGFQVLLMNVKHYSRPTTIKIPDSVRTSFASPKGRFLGAWPKNGFTRGPRNDDLGPFCVQVRASAVVFLAADIR